MRLEPNDRVGGYKITRFVREGSTGALYIAHRIGAPGFAPYSAVKLVTPKLFDTPEKSEALDEEIIRAAKVDDPRLVRLEELGDDRGTRYLAMECVRGFSLFDMLAFYYERDRRIRPGLAVYVAMQAALGMQATHEARDGKGNPLRLLHGALTTKRVLVTWKGHVKIVRLGLMGATKLFPLTSWQRLFRAPEQEGAGDGEEPDGRIDVYALGAVLLASLARGGLPVLDGAIDRSAIPDALARADDVPRELGEVIAHALEPRRSDRSNALSFYRELVDAMPSALKVTPSDVARELAAIRLDREFGAFAQDRSLVGASFVPPKMTDVPSPFSASPRQEEAASRIVVPATPRLPEILAREEPPPDVHSTPTTVPAAMESTGEEGDRKVVSAPPSDPVIIEPTPSAPIVGAASTEAVEPAPAAPARAPASEPAAPRASDPAPPAEPAKRAPFPPAAMVAIAFLAGVIVTLVYSALRRDESSARPPDATTTVAAQGAAGAPGAQLFPAFQPMPISSSLRAIAERGVATARPSATPPDVDGGGPTSAPDAAAPKADASAPNGRSAASTTAEDDEAFTRASSHVLAGDVQGGRAILDARFSKGVATGDELTLLRAICKEQHDTVCLDRLKSSR
ncbi:MAG: hypothetical protein JST00_33010 [Deltaproteobacteria bacterium]|nr:hypothetical protein [Deltaproteobacteria bacterium]